MKTNANLWKRMVFRTFEDSQMKKNSYENNTNVWKCKVFRRFWGSQRSQNPYENNTNLWKRKLIKAIGIQKSMPWSSKHPQWFIKIFLKPYKTKRFVHFVGRM